MILRNLILGILLLTIFSNQIYAQDSILVGGDENFPPFEYLDKKGDFKGFNVDISRAIFDRLDKEVYYTPMVWEEAMRSLKHGDIDAIQGVKYSQDRQKDFVFSKPYLIISDAIFVRSDNKSIIELEDLENKIVTVQKDDMAVMNIQDIPGIQIMNVKDQIEALELVNEGKADACVINKLTGFYIIQKKEYLKSIKMVGDEISPKYYCIALNKSHENLIPCINNAIDQINKDGTYDKIYKKWFGQMGVPFMEKYASYIYIIGLILIILAFISFTLYLWNRKLKEEVARRTKEIKDECEFKEQVLNSMHSSILTLDPNGEIIWVNEKTKTMLNIDLNDVIGINVWDTVLGSIIKKEDFNETYIKTNKMVEERQAEIKINSVKKILNYSIHPVLENKRELKAYTIVVRDVTGEKILLEKVISKDKLETLGVLVANISHEIKNPIMIMKSYMDLFKLKSNDQKFINKMVEELPKEIDNLTDKLLNVLDYSKPRELNVESINLKETLQTTLCFFKSYLKKNNINLELDIEIDAYIMADAHHIKQIVGNIIMNSVDVLKCKEDAKLQISLFAEQKKWVIRIMDNGEGIGDENLQNIFEPFYTTKEEGTGLGLSICQYLAKENGGEIKITSEKSVYTSTSISFSMLETTLK